MLQVFMANEKLSSELTQHLVFRQVTFFCINQLKADFKCRYTKHMKTLEGLEGLWISIKRATISYKTVFIFSTSRLSGTLIRHAAAE